MSARMEPVCPLLPAAMITHVHTELEGRRKREGKEKENIKQSISKTLRHWGFPCDPSTQY